MRTKETYSPITMEISAHESRIGNVGMIGLSGIVDRTNYKLFWACAKEHMSNGNYRGMVVDFTHVESIDSAIAAALVKIYSRAGYNEKGLAIVAPHGEERKRVIGRLEISRLDTILPVYDTIDDALSNIIIYRKKKEPMKRRWYHFLRASRGAKKDAA